MSELEHYIQSYFGVGESDMQHIVSLFHPEVLKKGAYFLKTGRQCNQLSFIQSGMMRVFVQMDEKEVTQWISTKGYFINDLSSLMFGTPARWTIQALTDTELYTIRKEDYERIGLLVPEWYQLEKLFIARCFTLLEDRIFSHLSMSAEERYHFFFENNRELFNQVPLQYIASMLGMTPETFSRIRKKTMN
jgi:CRP-like cAMP-binding protein